jgi:hypothetical protein
MLSCRCLCGKKFWSEKDTDTCPECARELDAQYSVPPSDVRVSLTRADIRERLSISRDVDV